jgi:hypothetical protein
MRKRKSTHLSSNLQLENDPGLELDAASGEVAEAKTSVDLDPTTNTRLRGDIWRMLMKRIETQMAK